MVFEKEVLHEVLLERDIALPRNGFGGQVKTTDHERDKHSAVNRESIMKQHLPRQDPQEGVISANRDQKAIFFQHPGHDSLHLMRSSVAE